VEIPKADINVSTLLRWRV